MQTAKNSFFFFPKFVIVQILAILGPEGTITLTKTRSSHIEEQNYTDYWANTETLKYMTDSDGSFSYDSFNFIRAHGYFIWFIFRSELARNIIYSRVQLRYLLSQYLSCFLWCK